MHERITFINDADDIAHTFSEMRYTIKDVTEVGGRYSTKETNKVEIRFSRMKWEKSPLPNANSQLYGMDCVITDDEVGGTYSGFIDDVNCSPTWFKLHLHVSEVDHSSSQNQSGQGQSKSQPPKQIQP